MGDCIFPLSAKISTIEVFTYNLISVGIGAGAGMGDGSRVLRNFAIIGRTMLFSVQTCTMGKGAKLM